MKYIDMDTNEKRTLSSNLVTSYMGGNTCAYALVDTCFYIYYTTEGAIDQVCVCCYCVCAVIVCV